MIEFKKWYFRIYLFFVRILIVSMIIGISFPVHVFGTTSDHAGQNWKINVSSNERQVVPDELKQLYALSAVLMDADSGRILFGKEEETIIIPAMEEMDKQGVLSFGPYAADGFFGSQNYDKFDGVLAMYHDQGLAPFKALAMEEGVNYTAGLPIVRTSPAHGTAYDIAGKNMASEDSFRQALYTALDIYRCRKFYKEATANPLRKQYFDKGGDNEKLDLTKDDAIDSI